MSQHTRAAQSSMFKPNLFVRINRTVGNGVQGGCLSCDHRTADVGAELSSIFDDVTVICTWNKLIRIIEYVLI